VSRTLLTIGYTGYSLPEFIQALRDRRVECLMDVREIPLSRKRGFSKTAFREALTGEGIAYRHYRALGSPRALRHRLRLTGDFEQFFAGVRERLLQPDSHRDLEELVRIATQQRSCLMCCCSDWHFCHRKCLIESIEAMSGWRFEHASLSEEEVRRRRAA
jgi:uncharacterized protein (DUF488 family)